VTPAAPAAQVTPAAPAAQVTPAAPAAQVTPAAPAAQVTPAATKDGIIQKVGELTTRKDNPLTVPGMIQIINSHGVQSLPALDQHPQEVLDAIWKELCLI